MAWRGEAVTGGLGWWFCWWDWSQMPDGQRLSSLWGRHHNVWHDSRSTTKSQIQNASWNKNKKLPVWNRSKIKTNIREEKNISDRSQHCSSEP